MKNILILILILIIGYQNFDSIKADIKHAMHVQYCNDYYMGRAEKLNACLLNE